MEALVLAAGEGIRLGKLTKREPKALLRVAGRRNIYNIYIFFGVIFDVPLYSLFAIIFHSALTAVIYAYRASVHMYAADIIEYTSVEKNKCVYIEGESWTQD